MSREDEFFREALKLDVSASDEINNRILRTVDRQKHHSGLGRAAMILATWCIIIFGTGFVVNVATGGKVFEYLKGNSDNTTYFFENGSNADPEIVQKESMGKTVFASVEGGINAYKTYGSSVITRTTAKATTSFASEGTVTVSSTYTYVNIDTFKFTKNNGNTSNCSVEFSAPANCSSVRIDSSHSVTADGQTWTAKTSVVY